MKNQNLIIFLLKVFVVFGLALKTTNAQVNTFTQVSVSSQQKTSAQLMDEYYFWMIHFMLDYGPEIYDKYQKPLLVSDAWASDNVLGGSLLMPSIAKIEIYGGTLRSKYFKGLSFATILCHEVGHFLGQGPRQQIPGAEWSALEAYSDQYAAEICLPKILSKYPERKYHQSDINPDIKTFCEGQELCEQVAQAGFDFVSYIEALENNAKGGQMLSSTSTSTSTSAFISTTAPTSTPQSFKSNLKIAIGEADAASILEKNYPTYQCRLETFLSQAKCFGQKFCHKPACWYSEN